MSSLFISFPDDFNNRYIEYREKFNVGKIPEPFLMNLFANERENLLLINDEDEYQHEIDKWKPLKILVDAIYKQLSPFMEKNQSVKIVLSDDLSENIVISVLMMLIYERVCRWKFGSAGITSNVPVTKFLSNEGIIVPSYQKFRDFRNEVHNFYNFIEENRDSKFSKFQPIKASAIPPDKMKHQTAALKSVLDDGLKEEALTDRILTRLNNMDGQVNELPNIEFNPTTGIGCVNSIRDFRFKDGSPEHMIFTQLYSRLTKKLSRQDVLIAGSFYEDYDKPDPSKKTLETTFINDRAKSIREKTGLNTQQLVMNAGNLTLLAKKSDKSTPKRPQK
ncbi:MAG: hypothetical protein V4519_03190 [Patescibacteria group bacterium]